MTARARHPLVAGLAIAVAYAGVVVGVRVTGHHVRPLFDGFAPPPPYNWVKPPNEFVTNTPPAHAKATVEVTNDGSRPAAPSTDDGQAMLNLDAGAIPGHPPDTSAVVTIDPFDALKLGKLAPNTRPDGNAYKIDLAYQPSNTPITALAKPSRVVLVTASGGQQLLYSPDGATWRELEKTPFAGGGDVAGTFAGPGYYLAARTGAPVTAAPSKSGKTTTIWIAVAVAVVAMVAAALLLRRRRTA